MQTPYDSQKEELYQVAGDADHGIASDTKLMNSAYAKPQIRYSGRYGEFVLECELYNLNGELALHLICPRCRNALWIKNTRKQMDFDRNSGFSCEPFECTWELDTDGRRMEFGLGLCNWKAVIDCNRARDA